MRPGATKMRWLLPIGAVTTQHCPGEPPHGYYRSRPHRVPQFFQPRRRRLRKKARPHLYGLGLAIATAITQTVERLNALLLPHTHRAHDGEFLWRSEWDESRHLREIALDAQPMVRVAAKSAASLLP